MDEKTISEIKAQHGDKLVCLVTPDGTELVFKPPTRAAFDRWFDRREVAPSESARELAFSCLAYPTQAELVQCLDRRPALLMGRSGILDQVTALAGLESETELQVKKL